MIEFNPQNRPRLVFIVEPNDEKRRLAVAARVLESGKDELTQTTRRFFFEQSELPDAMQQEIELMNCKRLLFNPATEEISFGARWLEWAENIRSWESARLRVGVDAFHRLMGETDGKTRLQIFPGEIVSQNNAERFYAYLQEPHQSITEFVLGVPSLDWLLVFMGVGGIRTHHDAIKELLDLSCPDAAFTMKPGDFMRKNLVEQGGDELQYYRYSQIVFLPDAVFPVIFGRVPIAPPEEMVADREEFYLFEPALETWTKKSSDTDGRSLAQVFCGADGTS